MSQHTAINTATAQTVIRGHAWMRFIIITLCRRTDRAGERQREGEGEGERKRETENERARERERVGDSERE